MKKRKIIVCIICVFTVMFMYGCGKSTDKARDTGIVDVKGSEYEDSYDDTLTFDNNGKVSDNITDTGSLYLQGGNRVTIDYGKNDNSSYIVTGDYLYNYEDGYSASKLKVKDNRIDGTVKCDDEVWKSVVFEDSGTGTINYADDESEPEDFKYTMNTDCISYVPESDDDTTHYLMLVDKYLYSDVYKRSDDSPSKTYIESDSKENDNSDQVEGKNYNDEKTSDYAFFCEDGKCCFNGEIGTFTQKNDIITARKQDEDVASVEYVIKYRLIENYLCVMETPETAKVKTDASKLTIKKNSISGTTRLGSSKDYILYTFKNDGTGTVDYSNYSSNYLYSDKPFKFGESNDDASPSDYIFDFKYKVNGKAVDIETVDDNKHISPSSDNSATFVLDNGIMYILVEKQVNNY